MEPRSWAAISICGVLIFSGVSAASEIAPASGAPASSSRGPQKSCQADYEQFNCASLEADSELNHYLRKCDQKANPVDYSEMIRSCLSSGAGAWGEVIKSLRDAPRAIAYGIAQDLKEKTKPVIQLNGYLKNCLKDIECKKNLFRVGRGRAPSEEEVQDLQGYENSWFPAPYTKIESLWNRAASRHHTKGIAADPWMTEQIHQIFGPPKKMAVQSNLVEDVQQFLDQKQDKFNCLNSAGQAEMICYGVFTVLDPALAYSAATKLPRLAKLIESTKTATVKVAEQASRKIGEKVTEVRKAIDEANGPPKLIPMNPNYKGEMVGESILGKAKVKYLETEAQRRPYMADIKEGRIVQKDGEPFGPWDPSRKQSELMKKARANHNVDSAIYIINEQGDLMINPAPVQGKFHHSSFTAGGAVQGAGEIQLDRTGKILSISNSSGHYSPGEDVLNRTIADLRSRGIKLKEKHRIRPPDKPGVVIVVFE